MESQDLLGYGKAKARAPRPGGAGAVQAEEPVTAARQLLRGVLRPELRNLRTLESPSSPPEMRTTLPGVL